MSDKKHSEGLFDAVKKVGDSARKDVQDSHKPHGIIDAVDQMGNSAREAVREAHQPHGIMDAANQMADSARNAVNQAHEQSVVEGKGKSTSLSEQQSASNSASNAGDEFAQAARNQQNQQGGTPYGSDSSSTTPSGVNQWVNGGDDTEFHGSGGVGSADYMKALREGHERAGGEFNSNMYSPDEVPNSKDETA